MEVLLPIVISPETAAVMTLIIPTNMMIDYRLILTTNDYQKSFYILIRVIIRPHLQLTVQSMILEMRTSRGPKMLM